MNLDTQNNGNTKLSQKPYTVDETASVATEIATEVTPEATPQETTDTRSKKTGTGKRGQSKKSPPQAATSVSEIDSPLPSDIEMEIDSLELAVKIRNEYDQKTIDSYVETGKENLPKPKIAYCPENTELHNKVIDGMYIIEACRELGETSIICQPIRITGEADALQKAAEANCRHGKQLSREEKTKVAKELHAAEYSQEAIARTLSVSQATVSRMIASTDETPRNEVRAEGANRNPIQVNKKDSPEQLVKKMEMTIKKLKESGLPEGLYTELLSFIPRIEAAFSQQDDDQEPEDGQDEVVDAAEVSPVSIGVSEKNAHNAHSAENSDATSHAASDLQHDSVDATVESETELEAEADTRQEDSLSAIAAGYSGMKAVSQHLCRSKYQQP